MSEGDPLIYVVVSPVRQVGTSEGHEHLET
jgi:hypothetical protein